MGAAPLLIMLAAVGVDYGWQPDGTTSPRGDNVEYIIQIPPDQLDQIKSIGEITSAVDPEIQGRVSKVIVRVGTDQLPRNAGRAATVAAVSHAITVGGDNADDAQIPIPEIRDNQNAIAQHRTDRGDLPGSESLMKPDPQSSGFALPNSLSNPVRTNEAVSTDPANNRDNQWSDIRGQSTTGGSGTNASTAGTATGGPSTDPVDPAARSTAWPTPTGQSNTAGTSGGDSTANPRSNPATSAAATSGTRQPTDPSDPNWSGYGTTPNFGTLPPGLNTGQATDLQRTAAGQVDSAIGTQQTRLQSAQQTMPQTAQQTAQQTFARDAAGNLLDRLGRPIDSLGRLIDPESGNLVDAAGNWIDQNGRKIDRFGRPLPNDATTTTQGSVASLQAPPLAPQQNAGGFYGQTTAGFPQVDQNTLQNQAWNPALAQNGLQGGFQTGMQNTSLLQGQGALLNQSPLNQQLASQQLLNQQLANQQLANQQLANQQYANQQFVNQQQGFGQNGFPATSTATDSRLLRQNGLNDARGSTGDDDEDHLRSASVARLALNSRRPSDTRGDELEPARQTAIARQAAATPTKTRRVEVQPLITFMLLISALGNAYLIFETSNLRRKFRSMMANIRATKISAQPAN